MRFLREQKEIYEVVSDFYKNKSLDPSEFSNRLFVMEKIVFDNYSMRDCVNFVEVREHWFEYENKNSLKSSLRYQINAMLKNLNLKLSKEGLEDLFEK